MTQLPPLLFLLLLPWTAVAATAVEKQGAVCGEPITVPECSDSLYNYTLLPNRLGHTSQEKIAEDLSHYSPLIKVKCSAQVKFFICSLFVPMCSSTLQRGITACRSVCEEVRDSCVPTLINFGFNWPPILNCSQFPDQKKGEVCMSQPDQADSSQGRSASPRPDQFPALTSAHSCPSSHVALDAGRCAPLCGKDVRFPRAHKDFAEVWMGAWAVLCAVVTAFTLLTCLLDSSRFQYPERAIVYIALCFHINSWAYIARLILGAEESSCAPLSTEQGEKYLVTGGLENVACVVMFMVLYYFWLASGVWWVVLSGTWCLSARQGWGREAVEGLSSYFHLAAWGLPAVLSIAVLVGRQVDASELTGLCLVGNADPMALAGFVLAPESGALGIGLFLNLAGFLGLHGVRRGLRRKNETADLAKLERLMTRIAVFSLLYVLPSTVLIGCHVYHFLLLSQPQRWHLNVELYMLQLFMGLMVGMTSGVWVLSRKTFLMWERRLCCRGGGDPQKTRAAEQSAPLVFPPQQYPDRPVPRFHSASSHSSSARHHHPLLNAPPPLSRR